MLELSTLIHFIIVFIVPMAPAALIFSKMPPKDIEADVNGAILGISFKAGGAAGFYLILVFAAAYIYDLTLNTKTIYQDAGFKIRLIGDAEAVEKFKTDVRSNIQVSFLEGPKVLAEHSGFNLDPYKETLTSDQFRFDKIHLGKEVTPQVYPTDSTHTLSPQKIILGEENFEMTLTLSSKSGGDWISAVDLNYLLYGNSGKTTRGINILLLDNRTGHDLSNVHLNTLDFQFLKRAKISAYKISKAERLRLIELWSASNLASSDNGDLLTNLTSTHEKLNEYTLLTEEIISEQELKSATIGIPKLKEGARFLYGITPRIEGLRGGVASSESIVVLLEFDRDASRESDFELPKEQKVGRRYVYPTERAIYVVATDESLGIGSQQKAIEYRSSTGNVDEIGDPIRRRTENFEILEMSGVPGDSFILISFPWVVNK